MSKVSKQRPAEAGGDATPLCRLFDSLPPELFAKVVASAVHNSPGDACALVQSLAANCALSDIDFSKDATWFELIAFIFDDGSAASAQRAKDMKRALRPAAESAQGTFAALCTEYAQLRRTIDAGVTFDLRQHHFVAQKMSTADLPNGLAWYSEALREFRKLLRRWHILRRYSLSAEYRVSAMKHEAQDEKETMASMSSGEKRRAEALEADYFREFHERPPRTFVDPRIHDRSHWPERSRDLGRVIRYFMPGRAPDPDPDSLWS